MSRFLLRCCCALFLCVCADSVASAQSIGSGIVSFLGSNVGKRVGGGECTHMAIEALRVSGGEFVPSDLGADNPAVGDYVWGTLLTTISYANGVLTDSNKTTLAQPGDIIQYRSTTFTYTTKSIVKYSQHTSVISAVNTAGRPTSVYEQNFGGVRTVRSSTIDTTKLTAGWIRIYRPIARKDATNAWKTTVVNNTATSQAYKIMVGTTVVSTVSAGTANTASSFRTHKVGTTGTVPCLVLANGQSLYLTNSKGIEIYSPSTGVYALRQLVP